MKEQSPVKYGIPAAFLETWVNLYADNEELFNKERYGFFLINEVGAIDLAECELKHENSEQICTDGRFF